MFQTIFQCVNFSFPVELNFSFNLMSIFIDTFSIDGILSWQIVFNIYNFLCEVIGKIIMALLQKEAMKYFFLQVSDGQSPVLKVA